MPGVRELSPELLEKAKKEVNEDPARRQEDIQHIREWLQKQPHLTARTDDQWILTFLRGCKFSLERTKEKLDTFYTMRTALPEFFSNRDPMSPEIQEILKIGNTIALPKSDSNGRRIFLGRMGCYDANKVPFEKLIKVNFMLIDVLLLEDDEAFINGTSHLLDFSGATLAHAMQMTPSMSKKMTSLFQEAYPMRPKAIYYYKPPGFFETVFNLVKSFLKEKIRRRISVHMNEETLFKELPKSCLPKEYGGDAGSLEDLVNHWKSKIESYRDFFIEDEKYKSDEKKRPGKPKTHEDLFGIEGSFRKLNVD